MAYLVAILDSFESCLVAYSGGVDSTFLAFMARRSLGEKMLAVIADSPSLPRRELREAEAVAHQFEIPLRVVQTREFDRPEYRKNPLNRCYFCKSELFGRLTAMARDEGFSVVLYGENASDMGDIRPGAHAAREFSVRAPLKEVGLRKEEIRRWSRRWGLPTAEKAAMACLSSRIPYGEKVSPEKLSMIERAEALLRELGCVQVRVRHHELGDPVRLEGPGGSGKRVRYLARVELGAEEIPRFFSTDQWRKIPEVLKEIGYSYVTLDLFGYRRGGLNEAARSNRAET